MRRTITTNSSDFLGHRETFCLTPEDDDEEEEDDEAEDNEYRQNRNYQQERDFDLEDRSTEKANRRYLHVING